MAKKKLSRRLVAWPTHVWLDVSKYVRSKYEVPTPTNKFNYNTFIHSQKFNYARFIADISHRQSMLLFSLLCKRLGITVMDDSRGTQLMCLTDEAEETIQYLKHSTATLEKVKQD